MPAPATPSRLGLVPLLRQHALLAGLALIYFLGSSWLNVRYMTDSAEKGVGAALGSFFLSVPQMIFFVLFWRLLHLTYVDRAPDRLARLKAEVRAFLAQRDRILGGVLGLGLMVVVMLSFTQMKNLIPTLNPFSWDMAFMQLDAALHFGQLPHVFLQAVFGGHYAISFFTGIYNVWLMLMYFMMLAACFMRPESRVRMQFMLAFVLTWAVGGNLLATVFSSAGPVYFSQLGLGDTYAPLMEALRAHAATGALTVVETQDLLWTLYSRPEQMNLISAFPSMHVGSSVLMAIFAFRWHRLAGIAVSIFAAAMMIGSVLLAWHYAVDGYAGALVAVLCWILAGWILRVPGIILRPADQG